MLTLCSVLLLHTTRSGSHYDLLIQDPAGPGLWGGRVAVPSQDWGTEPPFELIETPPHRVGYLTRQGAIGGDRGWVRRVDRGPVTPDLWTPRKKILRLNWPGFRGVLTLDRIDDRRWHCLAERSTRGDAGSPANTRLLGSS